MEKSNKRKLSGKSWAISSVIGLIVGASVATGVYFIYNSIANKTKKVILYNSPLESKIIGDVSIKMNEADPNTKEKKYFLSQHGLDQLAKRVKEDLNFGPEIFDLNSLEIDNKNMISDKELGIYRPAYDTINLNTDTYAKDGLVDVSKDTVETTEIENLKIELIMEVLFHEYGHYMSYKYLQGYSDHGKVKTWNRDFESGFEDSLGYSNKNSKPLLNKVDGRSWQSMGSIYSASDIYQRINFQKNSSFPEMKSKTWVPVWHGENDLFKTGNKIVAKANNLKYLWSLDELYTRKYEQLLYKPKEVLNPLTLNYIDSIGLWNFIKDGNPMIKASSPFIQDTLMYTDIIRNKGNYSLGTDYMADNPNSAPIASKLKPLLERHIGINDDLSVMFYDKNNRLRIGGYTNQDSYQITIGNKKYKADLYRDKYWENNSGLKNIWLSEPLDISQAIGKEIKMLDPAKKINVIPSVRHGNDGTITTHRTSIYHSNEYHLSYNTNKGVATATIEKGAGV